MERVAEKRIPLRFLTQTILAARKKEEIAGRFHRLMLMQKVALAWRESTERSREEKMQAQLEEEQRKAYEEDMERIRQVCVRCLRVPL